MTDHYGARIIYERTRMKRRITALETEVAELRRLLELARSDALVDVSPGYHHQQPSLIGCPLCLGRDSNCTRCSG